MSRHTRPSALDPTQQQGATDLPAGDGDLEAPHGRARGVWAVVPLAAITAVVLVPIVATAGALRRMIASQDD
jgi:hypothetical protein